MKSFEEPRIDVVEMAVEDIVTVSLPDGEIEDALGWA